MFLSLLFHMVQEEVVSDFSVFFKRKGDDQDQEQIRVLKSSQMTQSKLSNLSLVARAKSRQAQCMGRRTRLLFWSLCDTQKRCAPKERFSPKKVQDFAVRQLPFRAARKI